MDTHGCAQRPSPTPSTAHVLQERAPPQARSLEAYLRARVALHRRTADRSMASRTRINETMMRRLEQRKDLGHAHAAWVKATGRTEPGETCYRRGEPRHLPKRCRNDVSAAHAAQRPQTKQKPKVKLTRGRPEPCHDERDCGPWRARMFRRNQKPDISSRPPSRRLETVCQARKSCQEKIARQRMTR